MTPSVSPVTPTKGSDMTVSTIVTDSPITATGYGWGAEIHETHMLVAVRPDVSHDVLPEAIASLLTPTQRKHWTVEWSFEDAAGWDVYLVQRARPELTLL